MSLLNFMAVILIVISVEVYFCLHKMEQLRLDCENNITKVKNELQGLSKQVEELEKKYEEILIKECTSSPCMNGATCIDGIKSYLCLCMAGYNGKNCQTETDECASNPCSNNATCLDGINRYSCKCGPGYNGTQCQMNIDECASSPCLNGATCNDQVNGYMCTCTSDWTGTHCDQYINVNDCVEIRGKGFKSTGVYNVTLRNTRSVIQVSCDMSTDNGGWTVFQNRFNGSVDFYQNFSTYERGFGDLNGEFWLGLKYIQEMTAGSQTELRIDLTAADGSTAYEVFQNFFLTAGPDYRLNIDPGTGTAGDSNGLSYHKGWPFSAFDRDVDGSGSNCAIHLYGGWWYNECAHVNLNGKYITPGSRGDGLPMGYYDFKEYESLKATKMMFRRFE